MIPLHQWDIVKVRINAEDRDEHPAVIVTCDEFCADSRVLKLNVLYGTTRRPADRLDPYELTLNGADGLERATLFNCGVLYLVDRRKIVHVVGRVAPERRRQIGRKIVATFRFPLS